MGCGCGGGRTYTESSPLIIGEDDGSASVEVFTTITMMTLSAGSKLWVRGTGVAVMLDAGWLRLA